MLEECAVWTCKIVNSQIPFNANYLSFVCAILNINLKPLNTSNIDDELVHCKIFHLPKQHNHLKERIDQEDLDKKTPDIASHLLCAWIFFRNVPQTTGRWFTWINAWHISNKINEVIHQRTFKRWWWIWSFSE